MVINDNVLPAADRGLQKAVLCTHNRDGLRHPGIGARVRAPSRKQNYVAAHEHTSARSIDGHVPAVCSPRLTEPRVHGPFVQSRAPRVCAARHHTRAAPATGVQEVTEGWLV